MAGIIYFNTLKQKEVYSGPQNTMTLTEKVFPTKIKQQDKIYRVLPKTTEEKVKFFIKELNEWRVNHTLRSSGAKGNESKAATQSRKWPVVQSRSMST